jgi:GNAT superfamily N-acetyltransferase
LTDHRIHRCEHLDATAIAHLVEESRAEGFRHLTRLVTDYETGSNRFDQPGEALFIATHGDRVVGICGLNRDPHESGRVGRVRRLYVSQAYRRQGIARLLMAYVIEEARGHFERLVLRTDNPVADRFYRSLGFSAKASDEQVTHQLWLRSGG